MFTCCSTVPTPTPRPTPTASLQEWVPQDCSRETKMPTTIFDPLSSFGKSLSAILGNNQPVCTQTGNGGAAFTTTTTTTRVDPQGNTVVTTISTPKYEHRHEVQPAFVGGGGVQSGLRGKEITYATLLFNAIDIDHNGSLSRAELHLALKRYGFSDRKIDELFQNADTNGDNLLSLGTFCHVIARFHSLLRPSICKELY